jgi:arabinan endo-1,5-alpha-L-arabinosidase
MCSLLAALSISAGAALFSSPVYPPRPEGFKPFDDSDLRNPASWGFLNTHDPSIFCDPDSGIFYVYSTDMQKGMYVTPGCQIRKSKNIVDWEFVGRALSGGEIPSDVAAWANPVSLWAPDCAKVGSEYRLYYAASLFGKQRSAIALAVSDNPEGPFVPRGIVLITKADDPVNAIDPAIATVSNFADDGSSRGGKQYMAYGSFWGGIRLLELDPATGLLADGAAGAGNSGDGFGVIIARRPSSVQGAVEGPYIIFNKDTGYYYLFVSYGSLSSNYNVRVGRARSIGGPYLDWHGTAMTDLSVPPDSVGYKLTSGFRFGSGQGWFALGHNSVLERDGEWFLVHHVRPEGGQSWAYLNVRKMLWTSDGWPVANPMPYAGEKEQPLEAEDLSGKYECVLFEDAPAADVTPSVPLELKKNGTFALKTARGKVGGKWRLSGDERIDLEAGSWRAEVRALASWDPDQDAPTLSLTGLDGDGHCVWARRTVSKK